MPEILSDWQIGYFCNRADCFKIYDEEVCIGKMKLVFNNSEKSLKKGTNKYKTIRVDKPVPIPLNYY